MNYEILIPFVFLFITVFLLMLRISRIEKYLSKLQDYLNAQNLKK
ncbi:Uncharacterised protein [Phocoenobacter uteri]|uniref:Uncharacterized protein n=1 Tax=Phocoenobacter uteri TaxID=146806 RepID=A0A379DEI9_9PAST|nr:hypothetical protein [Phocoenobacter uteri]SUB76396.1 Uncharacterised protein [Phocoenobacter uteri]